jgi:hypothetical protein
MTSEYLVGELSLRLERLQTAAAEAAARRAAHGDRDAARDEFRNAERDVARLRHQVETGTSGLAPAADGALRLADWLCWESLSSGDIAEFNRCAEISADLRLFGVCARLLAEG